MCTGTYRVRGTCAQGLVSLFKPDPHSPTTIVVACSLGQDLHTPLPRYLDLVPCTRRPHSLPTSSPLQLDRQRPLASFPARPNPHLSTTLTLPDVLPSASPPSTTPTIATRATARYLQPRAFACYQDLRSNCKSAFISFTPFPPPYFDSLPRPDEKLVKGQKSPAATWLSRELLYSPSPTIPRAVSFVGSASGLSPTSPAPRLLISFRPFMFSSLDYLFDSSQSLRQAG